MSDDFVGVLLLIILLIIGFGNGGGGGPRSTRFVNTRNAPDPETLINTNLPE